MSDSVFTQLDGENDIDFQFRVLSICVQSLGARLTAMETWAMTPPPPPEPVHKVWLDGEKVGKVLSETLWPGEDFWDELAALRARVDALERR